MYAKKKSLPACDGLEVEPEPLGRIMPKSRGGDRSFGASTFDGITAGRLGTSISGLPLLVALPISSLTVKDVNFVKSLSTDGIPDSKPAASKSFFSVKPHLYLVREELSTSVSSIPL